MHHLFRTAALGAAGLAARHADRHLHVGRHPETIPLVVAGLAALLFGTRRRRATSTTSATM